MQTMNRFIFHFHMTDIILFLVTHVNINYDTAIIEFNENILIKMLL